MGLIDKPGKSECGRAVKALLELYTFVNMLYDECSTTKSATMCAHVTEGLEEVIKELVRAEQMGCTGSTEHLREELSEEMEYVRKITRRR